MNATHHIVSMKRDVTSGSQSPMWRCTTLENDRINVFSHNDPKKDNGLLFRNAGWWPEMNSMLQGEILNWTKCPIPVVCEKSGQFWNISAVIERPAGAAPDPMYRPDRVWHWKNAVTWAQAMIASPVALFFDTETTDTDFRAEIISLAILDHSGNRWFSSLVRPRDLEAVAATTEIHGLAAADLEDQPTFPELYAEIQRIMGCRVWIAYNAGFDAQMIEQNCAQHGLPPIVPLGVHDAMPYYGQYAYLWEPSYQRWQNVKLTEAAASCGIIVDAAHEALTDTETLYKLVHFMAGEAPNAQA